MKPLDKNFFKKLLYVTLGTLILVFGFFVFILPSKLTVGGVSGLSMSLNYYIPYISTGVFMIIINIILFAMGIFMIGKDFGILTIYSSMMFSVFTAILEYIIPNMKPINDDVLTNMLVGIIISAVGVAIVLNQNASTGGTDIVSKILNVYFHLELGKGMFIADLVVVAIGIFAFGIHLGMYAFLGILINSIVVDKAIAGFNTKINMMINTSKTEEVNHFILNVVGRGSTIYLGQGGYSGEPKSILNTVVSRSQYIKIKNYIKKTDPNAFISISPTTEVLGEGFSYDIITTNNIGIEDKGNKK